MLRKVSGNAYGTGKSSIATVILFVFFVFYLFMQHQLVGMYYDDFGNASLSYAYDSSEIQGTAYTIRDLMNWAQYIYNNWGGRIIYALILIPLLKNGPHLFMGVQVVVLSLIFRVMYLIVKRYSEHVNGIWIVLSFMIVYGFLRGDILAQGIYWASASVLYVWPLLAFLLTILLYGDLEEKLKVREKLYVRDFGGLFITIPMTTLSQEQIGGALLVWILCNSILAHGKNERLYWKLDCFTGIYALATFGIFFGAPGNWIRLAESQIDNRPIWEKIFINLQKVIYLMSHTQLKWFNFVLLVIGFMVIISLHKKVIYTVMAVLCMIPFGVIDILDILGIPIYTNLMKGLSFGLFLMEMFVLLLIYFGRRMQLQFMAIMIAAVASAVCLVFSPAFPLRTLLPYVFLCMILVAVVISNTLRENIHAWCAVGTVVGMFCLGTISFVNAGQIYDGYLKNSTINEYNFQTLKERKVVNGHIYLLEYENKVYRGTMSCDEGFEYIDYWIREYFDISHEIIIEWVPREDRVRY